MGVFISKCIHFLLRNWAILKKLIAWVSYFFVVYKYSPYYEVLLKLCSRMRRCLFVFLSKGSEKLRKQSNNQIMLSGSCAITSDSDSDFISGT